MKIINGKQFTAVTSAESLLDHKIIEELNCRNIPLKIFARNLKNSQKLLTTKSKLIETKSNHPKTFSNHLNGVHTVISTLSVPSGKNTIFDICLGYKNNIQLLEEALKHGVKKIIFVADLTNDLHKYIYVLEEKNNFISRLKKSGIDYTLIQYN